MLELVAEKLIFDQMRVFHYNIADEEAESLLHNLNNSLHAVK